MNTEGGKFYSKRGQHDSTHSSLNEARLAEAVYRCLLDAMIVMDQNGHIREFNPQAERMFGYEREEVIGQELADTIVPEEMREAHRKGLAHYLETGEGPVIDNRIEIIGLRKGGQRFPIELAISADEVDEGKIFVATLKDLTEEKAKQAELEQVRGYLDNIMEYGPTVFYVARPDDKEDEIVAWISPNLESIIDVDASALIKGTVRWRNQIHPVDLPHVVEQWAVCWEEGASQLEYRIYDQSDRLRWVRESRRVVGADSKEIIGSIEDITESRKSETRERTLRMELDHRVKNNLQVILGECEKAIASGDMQSERIIGLASRIRSMSIVHQSLADRSWSSIHMRELFQKSVDALVHPDHLNSIQYTGPRIEIAVDAGMTLGTIFNELVQNAVKYGGLSVQGGSVEVAWSIEGQGDAAALAVQWMEHVPGGGISPPKQKHFGLELIESMIPYELNGEVSLDFRPEGLKFEARIPLDHCQRDIGRVRGRIEEGEGHE